MTQVSAESVFFIGLTIGFLAGCLLTTWVKNRSDEGWWR